MPAMTRDEVHALPAMVNLTTAARALGCGRSLAYDLARRDQFPCRIIRVGKRYLVPTADLLRTLGVAADASGNPTPQTGVSASDEPDHPPT
jgi:hypothetical protein